MHIPIGAVILSVALFGAALSGCSTPIASGPNGTVAESRIYIKDMTRPAPGLVEVQFVRGETLLRNATQMDVSINDVLLATMLPKEHFSIWVKPNTYRFNVKTYITLANTADNGNELELQVKDRGIYHLQISSGLQNLTLKQVD
ncbi:NAD-GH domain containing protein [Herbaspirillum sp. RTI4]|uniref:NAD-GH domain containing protein n=1 Tax=Herbaspirillum sp. RTI4 TaxID=3048640 RepID=UPI002AB34500|nr:NAD-GH domain containing protein [Herbaspirillum sp. RTI4]MDY7579711.1 NAD-GH domain containing protein [Herbaspirillum sp. RTI4]MEA9983038.1 NAD-GH domain containing protein [Herbaspirillum sp. RTI4]